MTIRQITSRNNDLLKKIRLIASGSRRAPTGLAIAEGLRVLQEASKYNAIIETAVISEQFGNSGPEAELLRNWQRQKVDLLKVDEKLFKSISDVCSPQGAIALARLPLFPLAEAPAGPDSLILFACGIRDPGNLGTLIRSAAAAGASLVCTSPGTVSPRNPKAVRASAGALFRVAIAEEVDTESFLNHCRRHDIRVYRTDVQSGIPHTRADFRMPCALALGNESQGVSGNQWNESPAVRIVMAEGVESLNVAMAGTVLLFEAMRQRARG
jgi:TrmH family RNA methyltransferase